jgi:hypothetical protein
MERDEAGRIIMQNNIRGNSRRICLFRKRFLSFAGFKNAGKNLSRTYH